MKKIICLYGLWVFTACGLNPPSSRIPHVTVHTDNQPEPLNISFLNEDEKGYLNLSNELTFYGFSESGLFENSTPSNATESSLTNALIRMKISSICTTINKRKFTKDIFLTRYNFNFAVMDLIPHALFFQEENLFPSCSFFFAVTDTQGGTHHFAIKQTPMASIPKNKNLTLIDTAGEDLSFSENKIITWEDLDNFFLINQDPQPQQTLAFFCDQLNEVVELQDNPATPIFRLLYTSQNPLPSGIQTCRILSRINNKSTGITKAFKIDFSSFTHETPHIKLSELSLRLNLLPPEPLFQPGKWHHHVNTERKYKLIRSPKEDVSPDYNSPHINAVFELTGLPENFRSVKYSPVKIQVETKCIDEIFSEKSVVQYSYLNLIPYIPLMSITPAEVFQMSYPKNDTLPKARESDPTIKIWAVAYEKYKDYPKQTNRKLPVKCSYTFYFQDLETGAKLAYPPLTYSIHWNSGGIGIAYDHTDLKRGIPVFYEDILYEGAGNILFPFKTQIQTYSSHIQIYFEPNSIILKCGYGLKKHPKVPPYQSELPLEYMPFSIPLSEFLLNPEFKKYVKRQKTIKCRALLYKKNRLLYFSPEIQILSKTNDLIRTLRLRRIMYERSLSKDFIWKDIKRFFFTL